MAVHRKGSNVSITPSRKRNAPETVAIICNCGCATGRGCDATVDCACKQAWLAANAKAQASTYVID